MILSESIFVRLYAVSDKPNESGRYALTAFESDDFNREFDTDTINDELNFMRDCLYANGSWYQIGDDDLCGDDGKVCIQLGDDEEIRIVDVRDKIECQKGAKFYILVSEDFAEFEWIVCEFQKIVYSD